MPEFPNSLESDILVHPHINAAFPGTSWKKVGLPPGMILPNPERSP